jgi:hypothetical protein
MSDIDDKYEVEPYYQKRSESIVDMLFDAKLFADNLTRKDLQAIEDYIAFELQTGIDGAIRIKEIMHKYTTQPNPHKEQL